MPLTKEDVRTFAAYFAAVAFGWAQPAYQWIDYRLGGRGLDALDVVAIIGVMHVGPALLLWFLRILLSSGKWLMDVAVYSASILSVLRQIQLVYLGEAVTMGLPFKLAFIGLAVCVAVAGAFMLRRHAISFAAYLGIFSLLFPAHFIWSYSSAFVATVDLQEKTDQRPPAIFIFIFDELSLDILAGDAGSIDSKRFPNFDRLSREAVWFRQAISNYRWTSESVPSMMLGRFVDGATGMDDAVFIENENLLSVLRRNGYRIHFYSAHLRCPRVVFKCESWGKNVSLALNVSAFLLGNYIPQILSMRFIPRLVTHGHVLEGQMLSHLGGSELVRPGHASIIHLGVSHQPFMLSREGRAVASPHFGFTPGADVPEVLHRYREQVGYLDRQLGAFLESLERSGAAQQSIIVVTSDHGTCWVPECMGREHVRAVAPSLARVPMMIRASHLAPQTLDADYQHIDFFPTVLDVLGIGEVDLSAVDGRSALGPATETRKRIFYSEGQAIDVHLSP